MVDLRKPVIPDGEHRSRVRSLVQAHIIGQTHGVKIAAALYSNHLDALPQALTPPPDPAPPPSWCGTPYLDWLARQPHPITPTPAPRSTLFTRVASAVRRPRHGGQ